jgi:hypothetical protein
MALPSDWFAQVESAVLSQYAALKLKGDIDNSVLSAFLLSDSLSKSLTVISLGMGTKLLSGEHRSASTNIGPVLVHDCHAEVLAHRGLQCYLWSRLDTIRSFPPHLTLHFYSSTPPCGDCCVHQFPDSISVQTGAKPFGWSHDDLARSPPNVVRGKPGRGSRSQSVSCSDKLCLWINAGFEGSLLSEFTDRITVGSVCIGDGNAQSCERALFGRVGQLIGARIVTGKTDWKQMNESPSAAAFVWWEGAPKDGELISAKCGRKMGVVEKRQQDRRQFSLICDAVMIERYCLRKGIAEGCLREIKAQRSPYAERKAEIKAKLIQHGGEWAQKFEEEREWKWRADQTVVKLVQAAV